MAKARNPITFSEEFGVTTSRLNRLGVLDVTLAIDTKLFIDPLLLASSSHTEIRKTAASQYREHFEKIIRLLVASQRTGDAAWKAAACAIAAEIVDIGIRNSAKEDRQKLPDLEFVDGSTNTSPSKRK